MSAPSEDEGTTNAASCRVIRSGEAYRGRQGFTYLTGLTGATAGSRAICMTLLTLPDGARANTHLHRGIETAVYIVEGSAEMYFGRQLGERLQAVAGEYIYIPADMPHLVMNRSGAPCRALVAHTAADDQQGIVLLPELDARV
ncbi:MAG TPA: cupin domain-containing protein [Gemmatimonadales bacterium]|nr:cupin domain-containing protein [Gemmatimonadales bacterium]